MQQCLESTDEMGLSTEFAGSDSQGVSGSQFTVAYETLHRYLLGSWKGLPEEEVLQIIANILCDDYVIADGLATFVYPGPKFRKIGPFSRKLV